MPSIQRKNVAAGTPNAVTGLKFSKIGRNGAFVTVYGSTPTAGCTMTFSAEGGDREIFNLAEVNIEGSADVVSTQDDLLIAEEPVGPGDLFLQINTQIGNFNILIEEGPTPVL